MVLLAGACCADGATVETSASALVTRVLTPEVSLSFLLRCRCDDMLLCRIGLFAVFHESRTFAEATAKGRTMYSMISFLFVKLGTWPPFLEDLPRQLKKYTRAN